MIYKSSQTRQSTMSDKKLTLPYDFFVYLDDIDECNIDTIVNICHIFILLSFPNLVSNNELSNLPLSITYRSDLDLIEKCSIPIQKTSQNIKKIESLYPNFIDFIE